MRINKINFEGKTNSIEISDKVTKKSGLVLELKKDGTPEGVSKIENIERIRYTTSHPHEF